MMNNGFEVNKNQTGLSKIPSVYLILVFLSLLMSVFTVIFGSILFLGLAIISGTATCAYCMIADGIAVWKGKGVIGRLILFIGVFYWFWIDAFTSVLTETPFMPKNSIYPYFGSAAPEEVVSQGLLCVNLFMFSMTLGWNYIRLPIKFIRKIAGRIDPQTGRVSDVHMILLVLLSWVPVYIRFGGNLGIAWEAMTAMRSNYQYFLTSAGLLHHLHLFGIFGGALAISKLLLGSYKSRKMCFLAILLAVPLPFLGGSRFNFSYLMLPPMFVLFSGIKGDISWNRRKRVGLVFVLVFLFAILIQGAARNVGFKTYFKDSRPTFNSIFNQGFFGHEHFDAMLMAIDLVPEHHDYFFEPMLPYFLTHFIPRSWWPEKVYPKSWQYYNRVVTQGLPFNVTPSVIGQYYMNWGVFGVVFAGALFGWFARIGEVWFALLNIRRQLYSATVCGFWLAFLFLSFRILYPLYFAFPFFGFIAYWLLTNSSGKSRVKVILSQHQGAFSNP